MIISIAIEKTVYFHCMNCKDYYALKFDDKIC